MSDLGGNYMTNWQEEERKRVIELLKSDAQKGLSNNEAAKRLQPKRS